MKKRAGIVLLCVSLSWAALALDMPDREKKAKPVREPLTHTWDQPGESRSVLQAGTPTEAGMHSVPLDEIDASIETAIQQNYLPGAVVLIARRGVVVKEQAYGFAAKYRDDEFTLMDQPIRMQTDTIFDLASISKLFTSTAVMKVVEKGLLQLDKPVATYLSEFAANGKGHVTVRQLLTHTSGFPAYIPLYKKGASQAERMQIVLRQPLVNEPGSTYVYSDLNMITLGALVEKVTGKRLDSYIHTNITEPLGMSRTMYNPPKSLQNHMAATEYQSAPDRRLVWGEVQDENAWWLGGVAGHAGVFGTARDLAVFAQMMLNGGIYDGKRILSRQSVTWMTENQMSAFPGDAHGLGWELDRGTYMDALSDSRAMGHTGFTGTSIVVSPSQETIGILLSNRIHPIRDTVAMNPIRNRIMRQVALAIPVDIPWQDGAWFSGVGDDQQSTLTAEVNLATVGTLTYDTWFRIENEYDYGYVEVSRDGNSWDKMDKALTGESDWKSVSWKLPPGARFVRFRYATDETINGRGWYVHHPAVFDSNGHEVGVVWKSEGWQQVESRKVRK
ncbi:serine hydrolase domain-containing protein [Brevibacillus choshinensis]|uniref:serine hydrolase domain-containing protein n=1 Tax=Brevibacillus choshinensis TaxID=54911 RepID=UPI002E1E459E|nr:serine hydrolase [Brevibacillus choshinensis]